MNQVMTLAAVLLLSASLSACGGGINQKPAANNQATYEGSQISCRGNSVDACVCRCVAYFKEIGSYPTLSAPPNTGRRAEDVGRERCMRTTTAC
jgi:hypothetical protein